MTDSNSDDINLNDSTDDNTTIVKDVTSSGKWFITFFIALIALIFYNPLSLNITNKVVRGIDGNSFTTTGNYPSIYVILINTILFFLFLRLLVM